MIHEDITLTLVTANVALSQLAPLLLLSKAEEETDLGDYDYNERELKFMHDLSMSK